MCSPAWPARCWPRASPRPMPPPRPPSCTVWRPAGPRPARGRRRRRGGGRASHRPGGSADRGGRRGPRPARRDPRGPVRVSMPRPAAGPASTGPASTGPAERLHAEAPVDLSAISRQRRSACGPRMTGSPGHGRGQGRRLRSRQAPGRAGRGRPAARTGSAWCTWPRRCGCAGPGSAVPVLCLMALPERAHEDAVRAGIDLSAGSVPPGHAQIAARRGPPAAPAAPEGRHRARAAAAPPRGLAAGRWTPPSRPGRTARSRSPACGPTSPTPTSPATPRSRPQLSLPRTPRWPRPGPGVTPEVRHIANSAATLTLPESHFDLVRPGWRLYGLSPLPGGRPGLAPPGDDPAGGRLALVKRVPAGTGVSYGHVYVTDARHTTLAWSRSATPTGCPGPRVGRRWSGLASAVADRRGLHGPVRGRLRRPTGGRRRRGGAVRPG